MKKWAFLALSIILFACKSKKDKEPPSGSFPVLSYIQSQVKEVDTSLYAIIKITTVGERVDTAYIPREEFASVAYDFLTLPDISKTEWRQRYTETQTYDQMLEKAVLLYTAKEPELEVRSEQVLIQPGNGEPDEVKTIIIDHVVNKGDSTVQKNLIWQVNSHFQVATSIQKPNQPEKRILTKVIWK